MKIVWLGQAGLLFENENIKIMIDPYLSDSVKNTDPEKYRRAAVLDSLFKIKPDIMIWQRSFYDHVIRNQMSYEKIWNYC